MHHDYTIAHTITIGSGLTRPVGRAVHVDVTTGGAEALAAALETLDPTGPSWWSPHHWSGNHRSVDRWKAACAIAVDLDYQVMGRPPGKGHAPPPEEARASLDVVLSDTALSLAHPTPRGHRGVVLLERPVTNRSTYEELADAVARNIEAVLGPSRLACVDEQRVVQRPGFLVDRGALRNLAGMLWAPTCRPDNQAARTGALTCLRSLPTPTAALLRFSPQPQVSAAPHPRESLSALFERLLKIGAKEAGARGVGLRCPFHRDTQPSAIVFFLSGDLHCSACNRTWKLREWVATTTGRSMLGEALADRLLNRDQTAHPTLAELAQDVTLKELRDPPPHREFLVRDAAGAGIMPLGRVCLLGAPGGGGKSNAVVDLAASVASGSNWFDTWPAKQGRVLLVMAEETSEEIRRRLHFALKSSDEARLRAIAKNVTIVPAAGVGVALTYERDSDAGALPETPRASQLREILATAARDGRPYSLVVLDPSSRFAGSDVERDNAAATRYVQVLETFTAVEFGRPTVLIPAHTRKRSRDDERGSTDPLRGSSALRDGARWVAMMEARPLAEGAPELVEFIIAKSNYTRRTALVLRLDHEREGAPRAATEEEIAAYMAARAPAKATRDAERAKRNAEVAANILRVLAGAPASTNALVRKLKVSRAGVGAAVSTLHQERRIARCGGRNGLWELVSEGGLDHRRPGGLRSGGLAPMGGEDRDHQAATSSELIHE